MVSDRDGLHFLALAATVEYKHPSISLHNPTFQFQSKHWDTCVCSRLGLLHNMMYRKLSIQQREFTSALLRDTNKVLVCRCTEEKPSMVPDNHY